MEITSLTELKLSHRAYFVDVAHSGHVMVAARDGSGSLLVPDGLTCRQFRIKGQPDEVALSSDGALLAVTIRGRVDLIETAGFRVIHRIENESVGSCCFASTGALWTLSAWNEDTVAAEIREPVSWEVAGRGEYPRSNHHHPVPW